MADESLQHKLGRVRPPRVQITYDVEDNGSKKDKHLPLLVGIMADLSGDGEKNLPPLKQRDFKEIDRDNIDDVMRAEAPTLNYAVENTLTGEGQLRVNLKFDKLADFDPAAVAAQLDGVKELLALRRQLDEALGKLQTAPELGDLLQQVLSNTEKTRQLAREMGLPAAAPSKD